MESVISTAIGHIWPFVSCCIGLGMAIIGFGNVADILNANKNKTIQGD